jgi:hypothetical protein
MNRGSQKNRSGERESINLNSESFTNSRAVKEATRLLWIRPTSKGLFIAERHNVGHWRDTPHTNHTKVIFKTVLSSEKGDAAAQLNSGNCLQNGEGIL